jgi:hypothetical protein
MKRRKHGGRKGLVWRLTLIAAIAAWGLLLGFSSGGKLATSDHGPFDETVLWCLGGLLLVAVLCAVPTETRPVARTLGIASIAFTVALLAGHLVGTSTSSMTGPATRRR